MTFVWNETDFIEYFEVKPEIGQYEEERRFEVVQPPLRLLLSVFAITHDIYISVYCNSIESAIVDVVISDCSGARVVNDKRGNYIEFAAADIFGNRHYDGESVIPYGVRLFVRPNIRVALFRM